MASCSRVSVDQGWTPTGEVIDQIITGSLLITTQVTDVCEVGKTTIRRRMAEAEVKGQPLAVLTPAAI